jgi:hypothetical protein
MSPIVPYENDNPYRSFTLSESLAFLGYVFKKRPANILLYIQQFRAGSSAVSSMRCTYSPPVSDPNFTNYFYIPRKVSKCSNDSK